MLRKILNVLVVLPLAIVFIVFAVANRHLVTLSFDPFDSSDAAMGLALPLFVLIIAFVMLGVIVGGDGHSDAMLVVEDREAAL